MLPSTSKYDELFQDPDIKRWHDNPAAGSVITVGVVAILLAIIVILVVLLILSI